MVDRAWKRQERTVASMLGSRAEQHFNARTAKGPPEKCWLWQGRLNNRGYGLASPARHINITAHRLSYELFRGNVPAGLTIDHLCGNPRCVNPSHLEVVAMRVNILRGSSPSAHHARKTQCSQGHPYDLFNTRYYKGSRYCRMCTNGR